MKKAFLLFAVALASVSLTSCGSDDDAKDDDVIGDNGSGGTKLPKSEVRTIFYPSGSTEKFDYTYDGTKMKTATSSNSTTRVFTYNASNVLTKIEKKENDITISYTEYTFENEDPKSVTEYLISADNEKTKNFYTEYTYDTAAKTQTGVTTYYPGGVPTLSNVINVNTYDDNNLIKSVTTMITDNYNSVVLSNVYFYDSKPYFLKNSTGYPKTIVKETNNLVKIISTSLVKTDNVNYPPITSHITHEYEYDESGFPILDKYSGGDILVSSTEISYN